MLQGLVLITALLVLALGALLIYRRVRRRLAQGQVTEMERRFEHTLRRFHVEIDRFKFTRQSSVRVLLNHDHAIATFVEESAGEDEVKREELRLRVHRYVDEIIPFFRPLTYFGFGLGLARLLLETLYRVDVDPEQVQRLRSYSRERPRSMIYLMNHRSNVDYVLAAYALAEKLALSFAVGEWARVWPLEYLFKSFGSFFLRRGFRDPLYHTVLRRYVQLVTKNGVTQALFPEGGLSRDGRFRPPKIGLVDFIVCAKEDRSFDRELVFVPVAINYDRVLEDRALVAEQKQRRPVGSKLLMVSQVGKILFSNASKFYQQRIRKNGVAAVRFGEPISFDAWHEALGVDIFALPKEQRRAHVAQFCDAAMERIGALMPATPLCLVAKVLLDRAPVSVEALREAVGTEVERLQEKGVEVIGAERGVDWIVDGALLRFRLRHLIREEAGELHVAENEEPVLRYYANALAHFDDGEIPKVEAPAHLKAGAQAGS